MINVRYSWHHFWLWWSKFLYCMYISIWPLYVSWPHGSSAFPGWLLEWCLLSLCIHCWCGRFCCWWHGSQSVDLHPLVMLIHIYQRSPFCILLCSYAPPLPPWWSSKNIMWHIMPWICASITLCLYIWIYIIWAISLAITIIFVWEIDRVCISCVSGILGSEPG